MSYECNFLFEFLPCVLLILCFVSMIFLTHAGMISQHTPWQNSYALTIRCFHVASHINRGVTRIFSGVRTILQMPLSPNPLLNVTKGEIIVSRSVLTVYIPAVSRKVVGRNAHATIPKGNMGYDQYTVRND